MNWPIAEVARMSGVTARTLRHYDEIGLLPPARIETNGHRYYEEHQLLLLQQILVLRALGELMAAGHHVDAEPVQAEIDAQCRALTELRAVSADEYRAIGRSCADNDAWRAADEAIAPGLAAYQRDAIEAYTATRLS
ncbi:MerR family transcriptional regulator [Streptomyces sp. SAS_270]|uniref:MerR family transcriptional regulator n=1 Tax=Streptomyces sp. SAS_270 TaxID=3412748 RepID=UPI00403C0942